MMLTKKIAISALLALPLLGISQLACQASPVGPTAQASQVAVAANLYELKVNSLEGKPVALSTYKGKVTLVVNVASACGFTPQYEGLEKLYGEFKGKGLVVLGFPCNDFGGQESGSAAEIKEFCSSKFHVTFPMFEKVTVKAGAQQSPVYSFLTAGGDAPKWNFGKYLVGRDGKVIKFFGSTTSPESADLRKAIESALGASAKG